MRHCEKIQRQHLQCDIFSSSTVPYIVDEEVMLVHIHLNA